MRLWVRWTSGKHGNYSKRDWGWREQVHRSGLQLSYGQPYWESNTVLGIILLGPLCQQAPNFLWPRETAKALSNNTSPTGCERSGVSAGKAEKGSNHWKCSCRQRKPQSQLPWNRGRFCCREETTKLFEDHQENDQMVYLKFRRKEWLGKLKMVKEALKM